MQKRIEIWEQRFSISNDLDSEYLEYNYLVFKDISMVPFVLWGLDSSSLHSLSLCVKESSLDIVHLYVHLVNQCFHLFSAVYLYM